MEGQGGTMNLLVIKIWSYLISVLGIYTIRLSLLWVNNLFYLSAILPSMLERNSGYIIAISSVQGKIAIPYRSACKFNFNFFICIL